MKKIVLLAITSLLFSSCEKFLDKTPNDKAYQRDLFTDLSGFQMALASVYDGLNSPSLYGKELKFGFAETLVGTYVAPNSAHTYYRPYRHEYEVGNSVSYISQIWGNLYRTINEVNLMLESVDNIPTDANGKIVRGELLGLRAFCHFELLKLFGPVIKQEGLDLRAIPYRSKVDFVNTRFNSAQEVIDLLNQDLLAAKEFLKDDGIRTNLGRTGDGNSYTYDRYNSLIDRRGNRMNYYAVVALQSLVAQWKGDMPAAAGFAEELLTEVDQNDAFRLVLIGELTNTLNRRFPMENIFSLLNQNFRINALGTFAVMGDTRATSASPLLFSNYAWLGTNLYNAATHGSLSDFRYRDGTWITRDEGHSSRPYRITKFYFDETLLMTNVSYTSLYETKLISLHQMYMIAAEYYADTNPTKAIEYLNKVRNSRDIITPLVYSAALTPTVIKDYIFDEMRKENAGEGILFAEYKRLYRPIHRATMVPATLSRFKLPIPINEQTYNPQ